MNRRIALAAGPVLAVATTLLAHRFGLEPLAVRTAGVTDLLSMRVMAREGLWLNLVAALVIALVCRVLLY